ncbi:MAG: MULTIHEME-CYTC domain-containing protein [Burkholderia sp.]|jgi:DmsE family decaheme c-type cytochrome
MHAVSRFISSGLVLFTMGLGAMNASFAAETQPAESGNPCLACHADIGKHYANTRHAVKDGRAPGDNCATCHGETLRHMSNPTKEKPQFTFKKDAKGFMSEEELKASNKVCTTCHNTATQTHWKGSTHERNGVGCVTCHKAHKADVALNSKTSTALCISCHTQQKADMFKVSSHPILSGQMNCVSCHNPHGTKAGGTALLKKDTVNDTCFTCHPGKRGPFIHSHQPVSEDCSICHNPHGSNKISMLKMRDDQLCRSCHNDHHDFMQGSQRTGCTTCHNKVHGSNTVGGKALTK